MSTYFANALAATTIIFAASCGIIHKDNTVGCSIEGTVRDKNSNELLPGVSVSIEGTVLRTLTDIDGHFCIKDVPPGTYTLTFTGVGWISAKEIDVKVNVGLTRYIDKALSLQDFDPSKRL